MNIAEFKSRFRLQKIDIYVVDRHIYAEPLKVKLDINKNISEDDLKDKDSFNVLQFYDGFVVSKDGLLLPYGLEIFGNWNEGFAMDLHTTKSTLIGIDESGRNIFKTLRTPIAEDLYKLKYSKEKGKVENIAKHIAWYIRTLTNWKINLIIPVPPSDTTRSFQPVYELAKVIGNLCKLDVDFNVLKKLKPTSQLKGIEDTEERKEILRNAFDISPNILAGKSVLLFDDLFRSGESLNAVCNIIKNKAKAEYVYALAITKTRSKR